MFLKVLGGGIVKDHREWGASCNALSVNDTIIVVDCGIRITHGNDVSILPDLDLLDDKKIDLVCFTHAHADHIGAGPVIAARHPEAEIWMTGDTSDLSELQLADQLKVAERMNRSPLFTHDELQGFQQRTVVIPSERWEKIGGVEICFWPAGHLRGAASILIKNNDKVVMISGDVSLSNLPTVGAAKPLPAEYRGKSLTLITEATSGSEERVNYAAEQQRLVDAVKQILAGGGKVLIPAFALGKAQDVALSLADSGISVALGGMAEKVAKSYAYCDIGHPNISRLNRNDRNPDGDTRVVVTTHGMLEFGRSREFAYEWIEDPRNGIFIPGYQAPGTFGRKLLESPRGTAVIFEEKNPPSRIIRARVERFHLSGHSSGEDMAKWIIAMNPKRVLAVHGELGGYHGLRSHLRRRGYRKEVVPMFNGRSYET